MRSTTGSIVAVLSLLQSGVPPSLEAGPLEARQVAAAASQAAEYPVTETQAWGLLQNGARAKDIARRLASRQDDSETLRLLMEQRRYDEALKVLRAIVETRPKELAASFDAVSSNMREMLSDRARNYGPTLRAIVADARRRLDALPREEAAGAARQLVGVDAQLADDSSAWRAYLSRFVAEYAGTEAALLARVDLIGDRSGPEKNQALDAFIAAHPGTTAAARALFSKGFDLAHNSFSFGERRGHDPTDRFFLVVAIVNELRSGRYPSSEWTERGDSLITQFSAFEPSYAEGNAERVLAKLEEELPAQLRDYERDPIKSSIAFTIGFKMGDLLKLKGDPLAGIDAVFDRLERTAKSADVVRLVRAELYVRPSGRVFEAVDRSVRRARAAAVLEPLAKESSGFVQRKAIATLALVRFEDGKYDTARDLFRRYLDAYPSASYAWVAALRFAQCEEALGNRKAAIDAFPRAADRFAALTPASVLAHAFAAQAAEADGDFARALASYQSSLAAWDEDFGPVYSLNAMRQAAPGDSFPTAGDARVTRGALEQRIGELKRSTAIAGGALVERGRWFVARGRWKEAEAQLAAFGKTHAASPLASEANTLLHRARLEQALDLADAEKTATDIDASIAALKSLSAEPPDFAVVAARIALATIAALRGSDDSSAIMSDAIKMWQSLDDTKPLVRSDLERDVLAIRNAVFRPKGDGVFGGDNQGWNAFRWGPRTAPYFVVNPVLRVKPADGKAITVVANDAFPDLGSVLFLDPDRRSILERVMLKLGGSKRRPWTQVMQTPNQPAGASLDVLAFWQRSFWAQPGHWGGWVFETYPIIGEIEFIDAARTRATVKVTVGYSGATVQMEKRDGIWIARELTNFWIT
jgi:tetratricopeptide (TPR) repeat protein